MPDWRLPSKQLRLADTYDFAAAGGTVRVKTPIVASDAVPLSFLTALITANPPVEVVNVTGNVTIDGTGALPTIDGYAVQDSERVLLNAQTDPKENGIWIAHTLGTAWARPTDFAAGDHCAGESVAVKRGTVDADSIWICTTDPANDVVGTNNISFGRRDVSFHINTLEPMGFQTSDDTYTTISWNDGTTTFQIAPVGSRFDVWVQGVRYTFTAAQSVVGDGTDFTIAEGVWYFYFDNTGALKASQTGWQFSQHAPVAYMYWDATAGAAILFGDERHGITMDWATHEWAHDTIGARWDTRTGGLGVTASIVGDGSADAHAQCAVGNGTIHDEDLEIAITNGAGGTRFEQVLSATAQIPVYYRDGPSNWRKKTTNAFPVLEDGANRIKYNSYVAPNWTQPNVTVNGRFMAIWIFATNNYSEPIIAVLGQREDTIIADAENNNTFDSLNLTGLPFQEAKVLWRLIAQTSTTYGNTVHARWRGSQDYRTASPLPSGGTTVTEHNTLTGRDTFPAHPETSLSTSELDTNKILQPDGSNSVVFNTADIDNCVATDGAAAPTHTLMVGGKVFATTPTEEADGDLVAAWMDTFRRLVIRGANLDGYSLFVNDVNPALLRKFGPGAWPTLSAPGTTDEINVENWKNVIIAVTVASIDTNVVVQAEGSMDASSWFPIAARDNSITGWAISGAQGTATANGTYALVLYPIAVKWLRANFSSEAGGTNATLVFDPFCGNG